jgi:CRISPR-associated protein Csb1
MSNNTDPKANEEQLQKDIALLDKLLGVEARKPGKATSLPAAIRIIETLEPAGGKQVPVFPASYAGAGDNDPPVYDLAGIEYGEGKDTVRVKQGRTALVERIVKAKFCAIDSPQSQANRMEPAFLEAEDLRGLVPQATATIPKRENGTQSVLSLPHRVADFRVRLSNKANDVKNAIATFAKGDALLLLQNFPTSLLFGFWDSRGDEDVGVKHARILLSRIDAHNVVPCRRHSLYSGPYSKEEFRDVILDSADIDAKKLSGAGFTNAPSDGLGGVLLDQDKGEIKRISVLSLSDIARVNCGSPADTEKTNAARRYLFALAALAEAHERSKGSHRLRSGCELVANGEMTVEFRGKQPDNANELKSLYDDRARLIAIAKKSTEILGIKTTEQTYTVSASILKVTALREEDEVKKITTNVGNLKLAWEKADQAAKKAEEKATKSKTDSDNANTKAAEPNATEKHKEDARKKQDKAKKDAKDVEEKRQKTEKAKADYLEAKDDAGDIIQDVTVDEEVATADSKPSA